MTLSTTRSRRLGALGSAVALGLILTSCTTSPAGTGQGLSATAQDPSVTAVESAPSPQWKHSQYELDTSLGSPYLGDAVLPLSDTSWGTVDENGVLIVELNGEHVYHPVNSAWFMNQMLSGYTVTGDPEYLRRATATARYLIEWSVTDQNGTWFPYRFEHSPGDLDMGTPWYSGMAQGMLLSTFVNLYEITGDPYWRNYADRTFETYSAPRSDTAPWFRMEKILDGKKFLFFEEYPAKTDAQVSHVVNGNIYAMYGLYDYYRLTGNESARWLFDTAATSLRDSFGSYRNPGEPSWYAATYYGRTVWNSPAGYHKGVISQLRWLAKMTGDAQFTEQADILVQDHE